MTMGDAAEPLVHIKVFRSIRRELSFLLDLPVRRQ